MFSIGGRSTKSREAKTKSITAGEKQAIGHTDS